MFVIEIHDSDSEPEGSPAQPETQSSTSLPTTVPKIEETPPVVPHKPAPANSVIARGTETQKIRITREEKVDQIMYSTTVPLSFDLPYTPTVILLDLLALNTSISSYEERTRSPRMNLAGIPKSMSRYTASLWATTSSLIRRHQSCNGIDKCEILDPTLFSGLERFKAEAASPLELLLGSQHTAVSLEVKSCGPQLNVVRAIVR
ncbi:hypothetical protein K438DRAFT_1785887 [Mycena galopus ATCC 62051]|nr:hypothetical protein K438DRAFT_1785887 [Mycena galopus ATCC 62051]